MFHYTYLITDLEDKSFYIGVRSCECDPELDPYMGSGIHILRKIKKYGVQRFHKRVLKTFSTREEAMHAEATHVSAEFLKKMQPVGCLNLQVGGCGNNLGKKLPQGKGSRAHLVKSPAQIEQQKQWMAAGIAAQKGRKKTDAEKQRLSEIWKGRGRPKCSDEHKANISKAQLGVLRPCLSPEQALARTEAAKRSWATRRARAA